MPKVRLPLQKPNPELIPVSCDLTIGTSIGADSVVDACIGLNRAQIADPQTSQGCLGALVLSPCGFVGVNYTQSG